MIHTSSENWPPSRKREEAKALENLKKRLEQSKLYKTNRITDHSHLPVIATTSSINYELTQQQLDNRPKLLKKVDDGNLMIHAQKDIVSFDLWNDFDSG